jgi:3-phosphoglycerate kinase
LKLAEELSTYADYYVGDGFGAVHRKHASVFELANLMPHAAGDLIANEVEVLEKLTKNPSRPYGVVLGGAKVSDKIGVISNLLEKVDVLAIGGGMVLLSWQQRDLVSENL